MRERRETPGHHTTPREARVFSNHRNSIQNANTSERYSSAHNLWPLHRNACSVVRWGLLLARECDARGSGNIAPSSITTASQPVAPLIKAFVTKQLKFNFSDLIRCFTKPISYDFLSYSLQSFVRDNNKQ